MSHSSLTVSKSGLAIGLRRRSSIKTLNHQRSATIIARKIHSPRMRNRGRLVGGADVTEEPESVPEAKPGEGAPARTVPEVPSPPSPVVPPTPPSSPVEEFAQTNDKQRLSAGGPCCFCVSQIPGSVGDKRIDEIIEYANQNLEEAGKALATLGENFEHDLKLVFVDILGRIQQWSGIVQNKLDACKKEVNKLHKELLARACEVDIKTRELADLKAQIVDYQNAKKVEDKISEKRALAEDARAAIAKKIVTSDAVRVDDEKVKEVDERDRKERDVEYVNNIAIQTPQTEDRVKRESELESEVTRLRKENDRIVKERAEYESAIQRALLRGVSSLNVEALRVLRCPPIPCCSPCAPCPATATVPPQPVVPCPARSAKKRPGSAAATVCNARVSYDRNARNACDHQAYSSTTKRPCASPCCPAGRGQRAPAANNSMIFLLRQGDAGGLCTPDREAEAPVCGSSIVNKIEIPPLPRFG